MAALRGAGPPVYRGASWTTDAPFRETAAAIEANRARDILAVEMEAAALYAFARARGKPVLCLAHVTNQMAVSSGDFEKGEADGARRHWLSLPPSRALGISAGAARGDNAERSERFCAFAIMAKAPREGEVKTRLVPPLSPAEAVALSVGFIRDTAENILAAARNYGDRRVRRLFAAGFGSVVRGARTGGDPPAAAASDRPRREPVRRRVGPARRRLPRGLPCRCRQSDAADFRARRSRACARNAGRPGRSRSGRGWRLLPYRPQAAASPPVRGDRLEHRTRVPANDRPCRRDRAVRGCSAGLVRCR